jgi:hypothetical protein
MRRVFEHAARGRLIGTQTLQRAGTSHVALVAECWRAYCRLCSLAIQRGQAVKMGELGTVFPLHKRGTVGSTCVAQLSFDVAFLRRCVLIDDGRHWALLHVLCCARGAESETKGKGKTQERAAVSEHGCMCTDRACVKLYVYIVS